MRAAPRTERLVALAVAGAVLLDFPLLTLWDTDATVFGLPLLPVALFGGWGLLIACAAWIVHAGGAAPDGEPTERDERDGRGDG